MTVLATSPSRADARRWPATRAALAALSVVAALTACGDVADPSLDAEMPPAAATASGTPAADGTATTLPAPVSVVPSAVVERPVTESANGAPFTTKSPLR
jgi:hypothetical protein